MLHPDNNLNKNIYFSSFIFLLSEGLFGLLRKGNFYKEIFKEMLGVATNNIL